MGFDYFYGRGTEPFAFYQVPKMLITDDQFADITIDAKLLYSLMLDRSSLSAKNGWLDEDGKVYIYYTLDNYDHNEDYWKCISSGSTACTVTGADCINHAYLYDEFCGWSI